jgi:tetratricopeptide (TPR) repeat protein
MSGSLHTANEAAMLALPFRALVITPTEAPDGVIPEKIHNLEAAMRWFEAEHQVLLAVIDQAAAERAYTEVWQLAWTLTTFLSRRGLARELLSVNTQALEAAQRAADATGQLFARCGLGLAHLRLGNFDQADAEYRLALAGSGLLPPAGQAGVHMALAQCLERHGNHTRTSGMIWEAIEHTGKALALFQASEHAGGQARAHSELAWQYMQVSEPQRALPHAEQALIQHRAHGNRAYEAAVLDTLGHIHHQNGQHEIAIEYYQQSLHLSHEVGNRSGAVEVLLHLGDALHDIGDRAAHDHWLTALKILQEDGLPGADKILARLAASN